MPDAVPDSSGILRKYASISLFPVRSAAQKLMSVMEAKINNLIGGLWERTE
jgi:hypothetical protein